MNNQNHNITEHKMMEEKLKEYTENLEQLVEERTKALRESEEKLKAILTGIGDLITIQNKDLEIIWANQPVRDIWGDVIGKKCYKVYKGLTAKCPDCYVEEVVNEGKTIVSERVDILPDGRRIHLLITSSPVRDAEGNIVAFVEVEKDITERKELELQLKNYTENLEKLVEERTKALRESEEKLKAILTGIGDLITIQNKELDIIWVNQPIRNLWGDVIGKKCYEVYKGLTAPCPDCTVEFVFNEGKMIVTERPSILPDGSKIQMLTTSSPVRDAEGNIIGVVEVIKDITERKRAEESLRESEEKFRTLAEQSPNMIFINKKGRVVYANKRCEELMDYSKKEFYSPDFDFFSLIVPESIDLVKTAFSKQMKGEEVALYECSLITKDGNRIEAIINTKLINYEGERAILGIVTDITERKMAEKALETSKALYKTLASLLLMKDKKKQL